MGRRGVTDEVVTSLDEALLAHELVKVKLGKGTGLDTGQTAAILHERTSAQLAQVIGRTLLFYRPHPDNPTISLPPAEA